MKIYTRFEEARIIGARALQLAFGAPPLTKIENEIVDPLVIAEIEFERDVLPITVKRVMHGV
ncbi:MAG: DNA-directed RNA polymerase subunit K [Candidatus Thermoplasmatota archaeon]|jgi:DNA-directed RNA polymerase subunit K|nr:DNA-directed RNA polymerase subunit K [Candidatus Thermoplasmatota archaeon]MCL5963531.1 DNA-directed RNA polymerase subunit K [Candidatus Thermoplasmatota archaeon]